MTVAPEHQNVRPRIGRNHVTYKRLFQGLAPGTASAIGAPSMLGQAGARGAPRANALILGLAGPVLDLPTYIKVDNLTIEVLIITSGRSISNAESSLLPTRSFPASPNTRTYVPYYPNSFFVPASNMIVIEKIHY